MINKFDLKRQLPHFFNKARDGWVFYTCMSLPPEETHYISAQLKLTQIYLLFFFSIGYYFECTHPVPYFF